MTRPVSTRQPSTSSGRYWIRFSAKRTVLATSSRSTGTRLARRPRLISDQIPPDEVVLQDGWQTTLLMLALAKAGFT